MDTWFELMKRHAREILPVRDGESFDDYRARMTQALTPSQRAHMAAKAWADARQAYKSRVARRRVWVAAARLAFDPGPRCPCAVCGQYECITEAHHIYPLALQFDAGETQPIQESCWLCPTHHRLMHEIIEALIEIRQPRLEGVPFGERDRLDKIGVRFVHLWRRAQLQDRFLLKSA
ncbi:hypothetical protein [Bradyrhizobium iriomotense]|uniref:HNH endonuclease n=1 Tax=Bradyrhizobium iriomotense TaxID=441950 RepID=A0ABQ6B8N9_9BRAD|nr:hypothetical protein [Bradyrhizobium iriomotense]GLR89779.1 hypothetical protein GCM10007857_64930 [Bradyrhizobium iriomotense]